MKKMISAFAVGLVMLFALPASSQLRVGVNINIGDQPRWRSAGYDYVEYYYLPDIQTYYYVPGHQFIYLSNGRWVFSASLPYQYRHYDLYGGYKVVINRPNAYYYFNDHRARYGRSNFHADNGNHRGCYKQKHRRH